jgi:hypothetical protein
VIWPFKKTTMNKMPTLKFVRAIAFGVLLAGAAISVGLVLHAGRNNQSVLLGLLFVAWVLSPFLALLAANLISRRWPIAPRVTLYTMMVVLPVFSLVFYSGFWSPPGAKPAFVFLIVPLVSWLLTLMVVPLVLSRSKRRSQSRGDK